MPLLPMLILLAAAAAATPEAPRAAIEATIRGTDQPLEVELLLRTPSGEWEEVEHKRLPAGTRKVRFAGLASGVYQVRLRGPAPTEQLGTKIVVGAHDSRRTTIAVEPFTVTGRIMFGGTHLGAGAIELHHRELHWRAAVGLDRDGTFRAPFWQRGVFLAKVHGPALPTSFAETVELTEGQSVLKLAIPDGRITGIVRDAKSGAPLPGVIVDLQTPLADGGRHVQFTTGPEGTFDFTGIRYGRQIVRLYPPLHLEPEPVAFTIDDAQRLRELDLRLDPGREAAVTVIDRENDPVADATVYAVANGKVRSRTATDEDGRASIAMPADEPATLFVVPKEGPFGILRLPRDGTKGRLPIYLPRSTSSLLIRARTTTGETMPPFSLLMRYNGELVPSEVVEELAAVQGLQLMTGPESEAHLQNIPSGSYEFWPYRTDDEAQSIVASADALLAPIHVNVRVGANEIAVKFAAKGGGRR
ncbi:MAG TPA: carboxypeptidase-like regulatory domain-containing protein [Thermoanaerobaculia bacterium]